MILYLEKNYTLFGNLAVATLLITLTRNHNYIYLTWEAVTVHFSYWNAKLQDWSIRPGFTLVSGQWSGRRCRGWMVIPWVKTNTLKWVGVVVLVLMFDINILFILYLEGNDTLFGEKLYFIWKFSSGNTAYNTD